MIVSIIAAMDKNRLIGRDNDLPWRLPSDLAHFKKVTMSKPILMGRKTYDSIGRPLPGRKNIILSRDKNLEIEGVTVVNSLEEAMSAAWDADELMVIGGSAVYERVLPITQRMYLSLIDGEFEGDTWFPEFDEKDWEIVESEEQPAGEKGVPGCRFVTFQRK